MLGDGALAADLLGASFAPPSPLATRPPRLRRRLSRSPHGIPRRRASRPPPRLGLRWAGRRLAALQPGRAREARQAQRCRWARRKGKIARLEHLCAAPAAPTALCDPTRTLGGNRSTNIRETERTVLDSHNSSVHLRFIWSSRTQRVVPL